MTDPKNIFCFRAHVLTYWRLYHHELTVKVKIKVKLKVTLRPTVSRPVSLGVKQHLGPKAKFFVTVRQLLVCS
jgi:hypothetical protein